jgi:hypothetical protein
MKNLPMGSAENMRNAVEIEKCLGVCKTEMLKELFRAIEEGIPEYKLADAIEYDYDNDKSQHYCKNYYTAGRRAYPGISYLCKKDVEPGIDIWIRFEIDAYYGHILTSGFRQAFARKDGIRRLRRETECSWKSLVLICRLDLSVCFPTFRIQPVPFV